MLWLLAALTAMLVLPSSAAAQRCVAPPGTGAVDQYCEIVPEASGNSGAGGSSGGTGGELSNKEAAALSRSGREGAALRSFVEAGGAAPRTDNPRRAKADGGVRAARETRDAPAPPSSNPLSAVTSAASDGARLGGALVWILLALTIAAIGLAVVRTTTRRGAA